MPGMLSTYPSEPCSPTVSCPLRAAFSMLVLEISPRGSLPPRRCAPRTCRPRRHTCCCRSCRWPRRWSSRCSWRPENRGDRGKRAKGGRGGEEASQVIARACACMLHSVHVSGLCRISTHAYSKTPPPCTWGRCRWPRQPWRTSTSRISCRRRSTAHTSGGGASPKGGEGGGVNMLWRAGLAGACAHRTGGLQLCWAAAVLGDCCCCRARCTSWHPKAHSVQLPVVGST
mgnify:CR=1 FL=1